MDTKQAEELTQKYLNGTASLEERAIFESWYNQSVHGSPDPEAEPDYEVLQQRLVSSLPAGGYKKTYRLWPVIAAAASVIAVLSAGIWFYTYKAASPGKVSYHAGVRVNDVAPGKNGATITLASGKVIELSDEKSGVVIGDELKYNDGTEVQAPAEPSTPGFEMGPMLTVATAKGQTYQLTLADGTRVWLNADSKLEFPPAFKRVKQRNVKLSGEAYFEVAKLRALPFVVVSKGQEVEVLGTHFNINSYADEAGVKTTLLEGSVRVSYAGGRDDRHSLVLKPSQQSTVSGKNGIAVNNVDVSDVVAWKEGKFVFVRENVRSIMNKIARWYDVEIVYEGDVGGKALGGSVSRFKNVSEVLEMLSATRAVQFRIEGRRVIVMPFKE